MDRERRLLSVFLAMHSHKATSTDEPVAHLQFYSDTMPPDMPLLVLTEEDVFDALDAKSELVRQLLRQMRTYDCRRQRIVGLIFDKTTVLSEVLMVAQ